MASAQLDGGKHTMKQAISGVIRHDFRENKNYSNLDVDLTRSHLNQYFGCKTADEARKKLRLRVAECDALHPPQRIRQDRKTSLGIHIPAPREELDDDEKLREFFEGAYRELEELFGSSNVIFGVSHFDEIHEYYDSKDKQIHRSRSGLHVEIVPFTDEQEWILDKQKTGLNMNNFYKRNLPKLINNRLDAVCKRVFGFLYEDGSKTASKERVEELKALSKELKEHASKVEKNIRIIEAQELIISEKEEQINEVRAELARVEKQIKAGQATLEQAKKQFEQEKESYYKEQEKLFEERVNAEFTKMKKSLRVHKKEVLDKLQEEFEQKKAEAMKEAQKELRHENAEVLQHALARQINDVREYKEWKRSRGYSMQVTNSNNKQREIPFEGGL